MAEILVRVNNVSLKPNEVEVHRRDGKRYRQFTRTIDGTIRVDDGVLEFEKLLVSIPERKKRNDFVIVRASPAPELEETLRRMNRAMNLGERAIRNTPAVLGAKTKSTTEICDTDTGQCVTGSTDLEFMLSPPLEVSDFTDVEELEIGDDGSGLFWMRASNRYFDFYADVPSPTNRRSLVGVFVALESPRSRPHLTTDRRWDYADALMTPSEISVPGTLGSIQLRRFMTELDTHVVPNQQFAIQ